MNPAAKVKLREGRLQTGVSNFVSDTERVQYDCDAEPTDAETRTDTLIVLLVKSNGTCKHRASKWN